MAPKSRTFTIAARCSPSARAVVAPAGVTSWPLASPLIGSSLWPKTIGCPELSKPSRLLARCATGGRQKSRSPSNARARSARLCSSRFSWISSMMRSSSALTAAARNGPPSTNSVSRIPSVRRSNVTVVPAAGGSRKVILQVGSPRPAIANPVAGRSSTKASRSSLARIGKGRSKLTRAPSPAYRMRGWGSRVKVLDMSS